MGIGALNVAMQQQGLAIRPDTLRQLIYRSKDAPKGQRVGNAWAYDYADVVECLERKGKLPVAQS